MVGLRCGVGALRESSSGSAWRPAQSAPRPELQSPQGSFAKSSRINAIESSGPFASRQSPGRCRVCMMKSRVKSQVASRRVASVSQSVSVSVSGSGSPWPWPWPCRFSYEPKAWVASHAAVRRDESKCTDSGQCRRQHSLATRSQPIIPAACLLAPQPQIPHLIAIPAEQASPPVTTCSILLRISTSLKFSRRRCCVIPATCHLPLIEQPASPPSEPQ